MSSVNLKSLKHDSVSDMAPLNKIKERVLLQSGVSNSNLVPTTTSNLSFNNNYQNYNTTSSNPRSSAEPGAYSLHSLLDLTPSPDPERVREMLANEMGVSPSAAFDDIKGIVTKITAKVSAVEAQMSNSMATLSKMLPKLRKSIAFLVTNEEAGLQSQDNILAIYGYLHILAAESNKIDSSTLKHLEKARESLNEKLGIPENQTQEIDRGSTLVPQAPAPLKLFAKLPQQILESGLEKPELMRLSSVYELIETEVDYVQDLKTMINFHRVQVRDAVGEEEANSIFSNIDQLLVANQALANKMNAKRESNMFVSEIGDLLIECAESFEAYCVYASNYPTAMKLLTRPEMKGILTKLMSAPDARGLSLESFLIKPVQRICKYPLLIRDLGKYTEKAGNVKDGELLRKAAEKIEAVVTKVNEATRVAEEKQRILGIGSMIESNPPLFVEDRVHLKDGIINRIEKNGKPKDRYVVLYTDLVLVCIPIPRPAGIRTPQKYELECGYSVAELTLNLTIKDSLKGLKNNNVFGLNVLTEDKDIIQFMTNTPEELQKWIDVFQVALRDITEEHRIAARSLEAQQKALEKQQQSLGGGSIANLSTSDLFGRNGATASGVEKSKLKISRVAGLSVASSKRKSTRKSQFGEINTETEYFEPEFVQINGSVYKRALSTLGIPYYFNNQLKSSLWKLPAEYTILDENLNEVSTQGQSNTSKNEPAPSSPTRTTTQVSESTEQINNALEMIEGFPNWRKVNRENEVPYYFHIVTQETSWDPPTSQ